MIKLSEAIRLGSMLHPQSYTTGWQFAEGNTHLDAEPIRTCALGAAAKAIGIVPSLFHPSYDTATDGRNTTGTYTLRLPMEWGDTINTKANCPVCDCQKILIQMISHLNDHHRWTREAIADVVEKVENPLSAFRSEIVNESH